MYRIGKLKYYDDNFIKKYCHDLQNVSSEGDSREISRADLFMKLLIFRHITYDNTTLLQVLASLKNVFSLFSNIEVAIRIMLTIPVISVGAEGTFSKPKLIKNYLRCTLSQIHNTSYLTAIISIE